MAFYQLLPGTGSHAEGFKGTFKLFKHGTYPNPDSHDGGDVIESDDPLDKMFVNKFRRLNKYEVALWQKKAEREEKKRLKAKKAKLEEEKTDDYDDIEMDEDEPEPEKKPKKAVKEEEPEPEADEEEAAVESEGLGKDVTAKFPAADKADLKVFLKDKKYFVADADAPDKALNDEPLKKSEVNAFIDGQG